MQKHLLFSLLFSLFIISQSAEAQDVTVSGVLQDAESKELLQAVKVELEGSDIYTFTAADGTFSIESTPGSNVLIFSKDGTVYDRNSIIVPTSGGDFDMGTITISRPITVAEEDRIPTISILENELDQEDDLGDQNVSGLLTATGDAFLDAAAYTFSSARFRIRGYDSPESHLFLNGIPMNDLESGRVYWSAWGGLNDVMRNREVNVGLSNIRYAFGGVGGAVGLDTRASRQRKQLRASIAGSNRSYTQRAMLTYNTGMMANGWAFSLSGSRRWGNEGFIEGTFYDAYSYFASVDKKLNDAHSINLTLLGARNKRGKSIASVQRYYDLLDNNFYNPWWGYQNGKKRNSRIANTHQPMGILRHDWKISENASLMTSVSYQSGRNGGSAVERFDQEDPEEDDYKNDPHLIENEEIRDEILESYRTNPELAQIQWDDFYRKNSTGEFDDYDAFLLGVESGSMQGKWSKYFVEDRRYDADKANFNMVYENAVSDLMTLNFGLSYNYFKGHTFKVLDDLLGGDFIVDINNFEIGNGDAMQNDLNNPNRVIYEGDEFGYNYNAHINKAGSWIQGVFSTKKIDGHVAVDVSQTTFWRNGLYRNGLNPENSFGESEKQNFFNYGLKAGMVYKIDGRNYFSANGMYSTRAPVYRNSYVSVRNSDLLAPNLTDIITYGGEATYTYRSPNFKTRLTGYWTQFEDITETSFFLFNNDQNDLNQFGSYVMTDIDKRHMGLEFGIEFKVAPGLSVESAAALGQYYYTSRPQAFAYNNGKDLVVGPETIYLENYKLSQSPQSAYTFGLNYSSARFWFATLNVNYYHRNWIGVSPERRREFVAEHVEFGDTETWNQIIGQEELDGAVTVDFFGGKSFKIKDDYFVYLNLGVSNILNNRNFITGGFEQNRYGALRDLNRFPTKYFYGYGMNYFVSLTFKM